MSRYRRARLTAALRDPRVRAAVLYAEENPYTDDYDLSYDYRCIIWLV